MDGFRRFSGWLQQHAEPSNTLHSFRDFEALFDADEFPTPPPGGYLHASLKLF
jgi:hypothetical protein